MDALSPEQLYEQCGRPHTEPVERLNQRPLPNGVLGHVVVPIWLGKASERISLSEAQIIVTDYGESFSPITPVTLWIDRLLWILILSWPHASSLAD